MTVKQMIEQLQLLPDNMDVFVAERKTDFGYGLVNSLYTKEIPFHEDPFGSEIEDAPRVNVVVIDEE